MPTLQFFLPDSSTTFFELSEAERFTIGTAAENDLQVVDASISRGHAELLKSGGEYRIKDLGSTNKTWINDVAVVDVPLKEEATLRLGHVEGRFIEKSPTEIPDGLKTLPPLALLQITSGEQKGITHRFRATRLTLGWKSQNIIRLKDPSVSGQHAEITFEKGIYRIKDLESSNRTFLNGSEITEAELKHGDILSFGALEAIFHLAANKQQTAAAPSERAPHPAPATGDLDKLQKENAALREEIGALTAKLKAASDESAASLKVEQETHAGKLGKLQDDLSREQENARKISGEAATQLATLQALEKQLSEANAKLSKAETDAAAKTAELTKHEEALKSTGESHTAALQDLEKQLSEANAKLSKAETDAAAKTVELTKHEEALKSTGESHTAAFQALEKQLSEANAKLSKAETDAAAKTAELAKHEEALKSTGESHTAALQDLEKQLSEANAKLSKAETEAAAKTAELAKHEEALKSTGESHTATLQDLEKQLSEASAKLSKAETDAAAKTAELAKHEEALKTAQLAQEAALKSTEESHCASLAALKEAQEKAVTEKERELSELRNSLAEIRKKEKTSANEITRLTGELEKAEAANETQPGSSEELEAAKKEIEALAKQREAADTEASTLAAKLDDERQQSESIAIVNTQLQLDLDSVSNRVKDLEKRLTAVTEERDAVRLKVVELEHQFAALLAEQPALPAGKEEQASGVAKKGTAKPAAPAPVLKKKNASDTIRLESSPATLKNIIEEAPHAFSAMRKLLHTFIKNQRETTLLDQLLSSLHGLSTQTDKAHLTGAVTMTRALEALINELITTPSQITSSSLRSISQSLDFLATLFEEKNITRLQNPLNANIFAVDDDGDSRKVIRAAMEVIQLKITCAEDPAATLAILNEQVFDLIFIDVGLPDMNGFELCTKIRALPQHRKTPVVFLTGAVTVQNRVQSSLSGGNDFIAKPFNLLELGVKALTWILKGQLGLP